MASTPRHYQRRYAMLACAFLPFLPLIVDAHISQLGDQREGKRMEAAIFLDKAMRNSRGRESYRIFKKIDTALDVEMKITGAKVGQDVSRHDEYNKLVRLQELREANYCLDILGRVEFLVAILIVEPRANPRKKALDKENLRGLKGILGDLLDDADYWAVNRTNGYCVAFSSRKLTGHKLYRLIEFKKGFLPPCLEVTFAYARESAMMKALKNNDAAKLQK
jgi:hypothetical protein